MSSPFLDRYGTLLDNISRVVVAPERTIQLALLGLFAQGHVLIEDRPGVGKTMLAKAIAQSIAAEFRRVQFTPDLLPSDITGASIFNPRTNTFEFLPGPIFCNILLADELNRTNPRTQAALLEAMGEGQVTADGKTYALPQPFMVIATQNTLDSTGTFPLPDTELDRFLLRISIGVPAPEAEETILERAEHGDQQTAAVLTAVDVRDMQRAVRDVHVAPPLKTYLARLAAAVRAHPAVRGGMSPRATVQLMRAAQGWAAFSGRGFVTPDDVQDVATAVLAHRVQVDDREPRAAVAVIEEAVSRLPVPV